MRGVLAALAALGLVACGAGELAGGPASDNPAGGYTLEVRADRDVHVFLVTRPDGTSVAARATEGVSGLMEADAARAFTVLPVEGEDPPPEVLTFRVPGFDLSVSAAEGADAESARVSINAGGRKVEVDARDSGGNDRAHVRISGASEADVREFVTDAEELSAETQAEMLAALGLS